MDLSKQTGRDRKVQLSTPCSNQRRKKMNKQIVECQHCCFWEEWSNKDLMGICRRHAPRPIVVKNRVDLELLESFSDIEALAVYWPDTRATSGWGEGCNWKS
jgi:hypothetical protein